MVIDQSVNGLGMNLKALINAKKKIMWYLVRTIESYINKNNNDITVNGNYNQIRDFLFVLGYDVISF